jgi:HEAT repeat protein
VHEDSVVALNRSAELVARYTGVPNRDFDALRRSDRIVPSDLVLALRHPNPRVRFDSLALLDHLADESCFDAMIEATRDPVPRVRRMAAHALGCVRCKGDCVPSDIGHALITLALTDPAWRVRCEASISLAQQPATDRSRETLARVAAGDPHPTVRERAAWALRIHEGQPWSYGRRKASSDYAPRDEGHRGLT